MEQHVMKTDPTLPATQYGESEEEFKDKYSSYINPVLDRSKYKHIEGKEQIRVYVDGVFDMFHFGHSRYIMQAKNMFPNTYVIAGVASGENTAELKGKTVMTEEERCESVRECRYVDQVIRGAPWTVTPEFLDKHNIDFVVQNPAPYPMGDIPDIYAPLKEAGRFLPVIRTSCVSTSDYITRIISEYDEYLSRNLERGYSRQDLGISYLQEKRLAVRRKVEGVRSFVNGYIADFLTYFYQPISHRIVSFISPAPSDDEEEEGENKK